MFTLAMMAAVLLGQPAATAESAPAKQALAEKVKKLVVQLDDDSQTKRDAAQKALIELGHEVLDVLPPAGPKSSVELRARLGQVRTSIEKAYIESFTKPAKLSLTGKMKLSEAIGTIEKQSGNTLIDARPDFGQEQTNEEVELNIENGTFWEAIDKLLDAGGLTVYNYNNTPGQLRLMNAAPGDLPRQERASYAGLFRLEAKSLDATRDLRNPAGSGLRITTEISWEPRIRPIVLEMPLAELKAVDETGAEIKGTSEGEIEMPIEDANAGVDIDLQLGLPERSVRKIASVKGTFTALVPGRVESFQFTKLDKAKDEAMERGGVVVTLVSARKNDDVNEVRLRIKFDKSANALESHRGWIDNNEAYMLNAQGQKIEPGGRERNLVDENEVGYSYYFDPEEAPLATCHFVYKTPAALFKVPVEFELKNLELP